MQQNQLVRVLQSNGFLIASGPSGTDRQHRLKMLRGCQWCFLHWLGAISADGCTTEGRHSKEISVVAPEGKIGRIGSIRSRISTFVRSRKKECLFFWVLCAGGALVVVGKRVMQASCSVHPPHFWDRFTLVSKTLTLISKEVDCCLKVPPPAFPSIGFGDHWCWESDHFDTGPV